jgi:hypothetical protein
MTPASFVTVAGGVALAAQRAPQETATWRAPRSRSWRPCAARDTARTASNQARGVGGWRDGRHQLAVLAAGVTAALQARGVAGQSSP